MRRLLGVLVFSGVLASSQDIRGEVVGPVGGVFVVNTYTTDRQDYPAMCSTSDGRFVVVWAGGEQVRTEINGQRYASDGSPVGTEFQVNTYTTDEQHRPAIGCDGAGNFVVVWRQEQDQDGDGDGVFGQRFMSDGSFAGTEFQVNTYTTNDQGYPKICSGTAGDFVVSWESYGQDGDNPGIFAQRFASNGMFRGTEFQVNTFTTDFQKDPALCCAANGDFVVTWRSSLQGGTPQEVFAQRFASDGMFQGAEFQVNTYTTQAQRNPAVCCAADGDFVVSWESDNQDGSSGGVFGQRFASTGTPRGEEFQVANYTTNRQGDPAACCDPDGDFVIAWESQVEGGYGIPVRRFTDAGEPLDDEVLANFPTTSYQDTPAVVCRADDGFVVVWERFSSPATGAFDILGRLFAPPTPTSSPTPTSTAALPTVTATATVASTSTLPPPTPTSTSAVSVTPTLTLPTTAIASTPTPTPPTPTSTAGASATSTVAPPSATATGATTTTPSVPPTTGATTTTPSVPPTTVAPTNTIATGDCVGDCDGDGEVTVNELVRGVNIALELQTIRECPPFDANADDAVTIAELVQAVNALLSGCEGG